MAQIVHADGAETVNHDGTEYQADEHGIFDVPAEVAEKLISFPAWSRFTGRKKDKTATGDDVGKLREEIVALRADVDRLLELVVPPVTVAVPAADPAKDAPAKK